MDSSIHMGSIESLPKTERSMPKPGISKPAVENNNENSLPKILAYAAPAAGSFFFYTPMWSILPAVYVKHFGLELSAVEQWSY